MSLHFQRSYAWHAQAVDDLKEMELQQSENEAQQSLPAALALAANISDRKKLQQLQTIVFLAKRGISLHR